MFQSSPGPQAGRYLGPVVAEVTEQRDVSILARPAGRALPERRSASVYACPKFQSSPGPQAGRYTVTNPAVGDWVYQFQSSPGPQAGRYLDGALHRPVEQDVSILARPAGRALPVRREIRSHKRRTFQSSPGLRAGRYAGVAARGAAKPHAAHRYS